MSFKDIQREFIIAQSKYIKAVVKRELERDNEPQVPLPTGPLAGEGSFGKKPRTEEKGGPCAGNILGGIPCPVAEEERIRAPDTKEKGVVYPSCKVCKKAIAKARRDTKEKV